MSSNVHCYLFINRTSIKWLTLKHEYQIKTINILIGHDVQQFNRRIKKQLNQTC